MHTKQASVEKMVNLSLTALIAAVILSPIVPVNAQSDDVIGLVDVSMPSDDQVMPDQRSHYPDQFNAADSALTQGLAKKEAEPAHHTFPSPEEIKKELQDKGTSSAPLVRHIKSPAQPAEQDLRLDMEPIPSLLEETSAPAAPKLARTASFSQPAKQPSELSAPSVKKAQNTVGKEAVLQNKLLSSESKARELERQLGEAKSQLAAAELEIRRLSTVIENDSRARLNLPQLPSATTAQKQATAVTSFASMKAVAPQPQRAPDAAQDLQVATIVVDKADLRLGPGKNHSALMTLRKGSRLAIEARQGEWYRVFAPNGQRAWIHSSSVRFGEGAASANDGSSIRMRGFDAALN